MTEVGKQVKFVCEDGREIVIDSSSHYVATLVSMYDLHEVPDVIELKGSVSEVVSAEYDAWTRAVARLMKGRELLTCQAKWIMGERGVRISCENDTKLDEIGSVYLQEVSRIIRVFDLEPYDYTGILLNDETPQHERMMYHQYVGGWLWAHNGAGLIRFILGSSKGIPIGLDCLFEPIVDYMVDRAHKKREADEEFDYSVRILLSVCYNALMMNREATCIKVYDYVLWDDLVEAVKAIKREDHHDMIILEFSAEKGFSSLRRTS